MAKRSLRRRRRAGATVTFSVSVDKQTKALLRRLADADYHGNVSELITQVAHQAARQNAAGELLKMHGRKPMTDREAEAFEAEIALELEHQRPKKRRRRAA